MFTKTAEFYDRLYSFKDYGSEARLLTDILKQSSPGASTLLDVGCGTGVHLSVLKDGFEIEGLDLDPGLLAVAQGRLRDTVLHQADMTNFDTGRQYDVVTCLFSAIGYVRSVANLRRAIDCMARHLEAGGMLAIEPWFSVENFWTDKVTLNTVVHNDMSIAWMYVARREDRLSILDIQYMVGTPAGVSTFAEHHEMGLFSDADYRSAFAEAGLVDTEFLPDKPMRRGLYIARKSRS